MNAEEGDGFVTFDEDHASHIEKLVNKIVEYSLVEDNARRSPQLYVDGAALKASKMVSRTKNELRAYMMNIIERSS